jgi:hypothetical protein
MSEPQSPLPEDADERAIRILQAVMGIVAELTLDLDVTWGQARDVFAATLFERAEHRYGSAERIASALDTSLRTVRQYRHRRREEGTPEPTFNMRRRVLHLLDQGPATREQLEQRLPLGSDVNYAQGALRSLVEDGLVQHDENTGQYQKPSSKFRPWYLRPEAYDVERLERRLNYFARLLGSRVTPKAEAAPRPAALIGMYINLPAERLDDFMDELRGELKAFDTRWEQIAAEATPDSARVLTGGVMSFGYLGSPIDRSTVEGEGGGGGTPLPPVSDADTRHL